MYHLGRNGIYRYFAEKQQVFSNRWYGHFAFSRSAVIPQAALGAREGLVTVFALSILYLAGS